MKTFLIVLTPLLAIFLLSGCATSGKTATSTLYVPHFVWTPASKASIGSSNVTMAVVSPVYTTKEDWVKIPVFKNFSKYLGSSFEELLVARGFTVKGPYDGIQSMTYPDKKGSDLGIYPSLEITLDASSFKTHSKEQINLLGPNQIVYYQEGEMILGGRVSLVAIEPLSGEKMWVKNIQLEDTRVICKGEKKYRSAQEAGADNTDPGIMNPLNKALESYFPIILQTAWNYIDPEEMALIKSKSLEIRAKKVY